MYRTDKEDTMRCPYCGHSLGRKMSYCPHCGKPLRAGHATTAKQAGHLHGAAPWIVLLIVVSILLAGIAMFFLWTHNAVKSDPVPAGLDTYDSISQEPSDPEAAEISGTPGTPLTAADVTWVVEPSYTYDDVEPVYSYLFDHLTGEPLQQGESYSIYDNYYAITRGDSYSLFEVTTHSEYPDWQTGLTAENGYPTILTYETTESKINLYPLEDTPPVDPIWECIGSSLSHGACCGAVVYDPESQSFLYVVVSEMDESISVETPFGQSSWPKPYPVIQCAPEQVTYGDPPYPTYSVGGYENYYRMPLDTLFGYVSPDGTLLADFQFDNATGFSDGLAACSKDGKWGYIDASGTPVTDFVYDPLLPVGAFSSVAGGEYDIIRYGYPCTCDTMVVSKDGQVGLLYRDGTTLLDFGEFEDLAPAYDDQLWAKQNGLWGLIDLKALKEKALGAA